MKLTEHLVKQIEHAQGAGIDLTTLVIEGEGEQASLKQPSGDPVPPGNPPPVPPLT
jgi:hypothetical protein